MDVHIDSRQVDMTPRWRAEIEARVADLQAGHDDLTHARITLTKNRHHKKADDVAEALIVVTLPGRTITARKREKTFEEAIREAFSAVSIELEKFREKRASHEIRVPPVPLRGIVSKVFRDQDYGFLVPEGGGEEVYFHRHAVHDLSFDDLQDGMEVSFNLEQGLKGPQATTVNPVPLKEPKD
jgi:cold shock CspA family protein/ribosome-associated translation inhibitor RaiA